MNADVLCCSFRLQLAWMKESLRQQHLAYVARLVASLSEHWLGPLDAPRLWLKAS